MSRFLGSAVSRCLGVSVSRFLGFVVSWFRSFAVSRCRGFAVLRSRGVAMGNQAVYFWARMIKTRAIMPNTMLGIHTPRIGEKERLFTNVDENLDKTT